jgi:hypothetical protein
MEGCCEDEPAAFQQLAADGREDGLRRGRVLEMVVRYREVKGFGLRHKAGFGQAHGDTHHARQRQVHGRGGAGQKQPGPGLNARGLDEMQHGAVAIVQLVPAVALHGLAPVRHVATIGQPGALCRARGEARAAQAGRAGAGLDDTGLRRGEGLLVGVARIEQALAVGQIFPELRLRGEPHCREGRGPGKAAGLEGGGWDFGGEKGHGCRSARKFGVGKGKAVRGKRKMFVTGPGLGYIIKKHY